MAYLFIYLFLWEKSFESSIMLPTYTNNDLGWGLS